MIVFRTSVSDEAGYRHLQRCIYLGAALRKDVDILFCVDKDKRTLELLKEKKFRVCLAGARETIEKENPETIVFDVYRFSKFDTELLDWATANKRRTVQFAKWGLDRQAVDVVIDDACSFLMPYADGAPQLGGPEFAVLHHRFRHFNKSRRKYRSSNRNILIDLGETLDYRTFRETVDIVSRFVKHVKIVPGYFMKKGNKKTLKRIYQNVRFAGKTDSFARAYFEADVVLIPPGLEAYQAAATGTPALYLPVDQKQEEFASELEKRQLGLNLGVAASLSKKTFKAQLERLSLGTRLEMGATGKNLVDGRGAGRIIDFFEKNVII